MAEIGSSVWGTLANFNRCHILASLLQYRRSAEAIARWHLLGWYTVHTFSGTIASWWNFARCRIDFTSKSCVLYWQRYCMALQQRASAKLCGVVQGVELLNFHRGRRLYSSGQPSRGHWPTLFFGLRTARTSGPILTICTSYDVFPCKEVPFGGRDETPSHLGVKSPKTFILGVWIGIFKPKSQNIKTCMLLKVLYRFQPDFAQW